MAQDDENGFFNDPVTALSFLLVVVRKTISFCHPDPTRKAYPGRISKRYGFIMVDKGLDRNDKARDIVSELCGQGK